MSHGQANVVTLYDKDGNEVDVVLVDGQHRLLTSDPDTKDALDRITVILDNLYQLLLARGS